MYDIQLINGLPVIPALCRFVTGLLLCLLFMGYGAGCSGMRYKKTEKDPIAYLLQRLQKDTLGAKVLQHPDVYEVQFIYTQIDRDANGRPVFRSFGYNVDSTRYFYPASMVKMPLALLSLEKINRLKRQGVDLNKETHYRLDSLRAFQQNYSIDAGAPGGKPSIAHDVRQIFVVSDNLAYNHCFEWLGREYINRTLREKGYTRTGIVHRFNYPGRDNRYASPISFYGQGAGIFQEGEKFDNQVWVNPQHHTLKGKGYLDLKDSLVNTPFDFSKKNWFALTDMEQMLKAVLFPESVPERQRFDLTEEDYRFLWHYMGIFPRECDYPRYDSTFYDSYAKFLMFGDRQAPLEGQVRSFNKIGEAYGTMTDVAYLVDMEKGTECILAATILCNPDGIFNDDRYDYETTGFPFLGLLGREVFRYDAGRPRKGTADLSVLQKAIGYQKK